MDAEGRRVILMIMNCRGEDCVKFVFCVKVSNDLADYVRVACHLCEETTPLTRWIIILLHNSPQ